MHMLIYSIIPHQSLYHLELTVYRKHWMHVLCEYCLWCDCGNSWKIYVTKTPRKNAVSYKIRYKINSDLCLKSNEFDSFLMSQMWTTHSILWYYFSKSSRNICLFVTPQLINDRWWKDVHSQCISVSHVQLYNVALCLQLLWQHRLQCQACSRWLGSRGRRWRCPPTSSQKQLFLELFPVSSRLWRVPPFAQPALSPPRLVAQHRWMPLPPKYKHRRHKRRFVCYFILQLNLFCDCREHV